MKTKTKKRPAIKERITPKMGTPIFETSHFDRWKGVISSHPNLLVLIFLSLVGVLLYINSIHNQLVFDDVPVFLKNKIEILGNRPEWTVREFLHIEPVSSMEMTRRTYGKRGLREAYKRNLEMVVLEVLRLLNCLSGKTVITSDHGELLGEGRCYGHWRGSTNPYLIEIPWLILEKQSGGRADTNSKMGNEKGKVKDMEEDQDKIMKRLRDLGYHD